MRFCVPQPGDILEVKQSVVVRAPFTYINKNFDVHSDVTPEVGKLSNRDRHQWRFCGPGRDLKSFEFEIPAGTRVCIGQVYVRKGGWYDNTIVLAFDKNQVDYLRRRTVRIYIGSFEEIDFEFLKKKPRVMGER